MSINNIESLLEKYWEGESSLAEESQLKDYFSSGSYDKKFEDVAPLFQLFTEEKEQQTERSFEGVLSSAPVISIKNVKKYLTGIAALLILSFGAYYFVDRFEAMDKQSQMAYEIDDPEEALEQTMQALAMLSDKWNTSTKTLESEIHHISKVDIFKN